MPRKSTKTRPTGLGYYFTMTADILRKLEKELDKGISSEVQVVYVMTGIRKLLERGNLRNKYQALAFYCDWALHTRMDRREALRRIKQFDDLVESQAGAKPGPKQLDAEIVRLTSGDQLREELNSFLEEHGLPRGVCDDAHSWRRFLEEYGNVITDCPLEYNLPRMRHVKSIVVRRIDPPIEMFGPGGMSTRFALEWRLKFFDRDEDYTWVANL